MFNNHKSWSCVWCWTCEQMYGNAQRISLACWKSNLRYIKGTLTRYLDASGDDANLVSYSKTEVVIRMKVNAQMGISFVLIQQLLVRPRKKKGLCLSLHVKLNI